MQLIVCFIALMYQLSRVFISCMISGVTNGLIYSLDRSVFVEDIKKQDTVHLHLITDIIKKVYNVKRNELKILLEFLRAVASIAPNRHIRGFSLGIFEFSNK